MPIRFEIAPNGDPKNIVTWKGGTGSGKNVGPNTVLVLADDAQFSGFNGQDYIEVTIRAISDSDSSFHTSYIDETIRIKAPSKSAFFDERRLDNRYDGKLSEFKKRFGSGHPLNSLPEEKLKGLFDNDNYDSDGDGISNVLERAFGGDSLKSDSESVLPRPIKSKPSGEEEKEFITFLRFNNNYNNEGIEYIVETSRDLRTWLPESDADGAEPHGSAVDVGGGMERVVYKTKKTRTYNGNDKIFIRVRVKTK